MAIACTGSRARATRCPSDPRVPPSGAAAPTEAPDSVIRIARSTPVKIDKPQGSIRRVHAEPAIERGARGAAGEIAWLALWPDRTVSYHANACAPRGVWISETPRAP